LGYFKDTFFLKVKANQNNCIMKVQSNMIFQRYVFLKSESKSKLKLSAAEKQAGYFKDTFFLKVKANQNSECLSNVRYFDISKIRFS